ncbi:MAG: MarR family winged helix-turn-helix transcriptional regulator [Actinomycetota bacterium]|jgi:DNA-binding MarR family transcriptional regulator
MSGKEPKWLSSREMKAWRAYIIASRRLLEALEQDLEDHDLSMPDYEVLAQLSEAPGRRMRMSELAEIAMLSKSRLSHRITVMEKAGWVKRQACTEDKRGSWAVMTEKGYRAIVKAAPDHVRSVRKRFLDQLSGKDQESISALFDRIQTGLREEFKNEK